MLLSFDMKSLFKTGIFGAMGSFLAILFFLIFIILGFYQPGYNHFSNTISALVVGKMGWVQTLNFYILAASFMCIGFGLGKSLTHRYFNKIFFMFLVAAIGAFFVAIVPADKVSAQEIIQVNNLSFEGKVHWFFVLGLILLMPIVFYPVIQNMQRNSDWKKLIPYTVILLVFNLVGGVLWYCFVSAGYLLEWKGLIQKILATSVLFWLAIVGCRLWMLDSRQKLGLNKRALD